MFKTIDTKPDYPAMENAILDFWEDRGIFEKLRKKNEKGPKWKFLDGPITANNPMGVHHAWGRMLKDVFHRYHGMLGHHMRYQNGFDCQGLWVEVEVEKQLGFKTKKDIETYGVDRFVEACKERVRKFSKRQTEQSIRLGYWMDWDNSYYTMSDENNYTIWTFLKKCHDRGWIYQGEDVMPWCARCGTGLSQQEMHEGYKIVADEAVFVRFPLTGRDKEYLLVWTTTPWTLTSNVAAAVNPDIPYAKVRAGGDVYYLAEEALDFLRREDDCKSNEWVKGVPPLKSAGDVLRAFGGELEVLSVLEGSAMVGWTYEGPFDGLPAQSVDGGSPKPNSRLAGKTGISCHRVIGWDFVGGTEGTGIVHIAPGCGKEDYDLAKEHDLVSIAPLSEGGVYLDGFDFLTGHRVPSDEVNRLILDDLKTRGVLVGKELYPHSYPHCWRCSEGLIFRQVDEWFISMDELRHEIKDVARKIQWMPEFGLQQELDWLNNMHDWMITKKRYWGLALPIYPCSCGWFGVVGGEEELRERSVEGWEAFEGHSPHRPFIDEVKIRCEKCGAAVSRIPDVGNPWLDAGIVPYSTLDYRHDPEYWASWCPFDFITECFPGQFRNWFYCLLAMSTVMENVEPFKVVLGHALVKDEGGKEMHKSTGNVIWFDEAAEKMGVDVMRWVFATQNPFQNLNFGYQAGHGVKRRMLTLWNVCSFFATYANLDEPDLGAPEPSELSLLDRWLLSKLQMLVQKARGAYESYTITPFALEAERFLDDLSNWYIRRSRRRFWKSDADHDKQAAYRTLYHTIVTYSRLIAPILPFTAEEIHQALVLPVDKAAAESVHLEAFPEFRPSWVDPDLTAEMDAVMSLVNLALSARQAANLKVRQPLARVIVLPGDDGDPEKLKKYRDIILEEINVKRLEFVDAAEDLETLSLRPLMAQLGKKYGPRAQAVKTAVEAVPHDQVVGLDAEEDDITVNVEGASIKVTPGEYEVLRKPKPGYSTASDHGWVVAIETVLTPELEIEGLSRDVVRRVQNLRKDAGFEVSDRITIQYAAQGRIADVMDACRDYIMVETLAVSIEASDEPGGDHVAETKIAGEVLTIGLTVRKD
jgi:isoleucyl-tRNA synthetase